MKLVLNRITQEASYAGRSIKKIMIVMLNGLVQIANKMALKKTVDWLTYLYPLQATHNSSVL
jgi:hypothetical protein